MTDDDPNEAYDIDYAVPFVIPRGWCTLRVNGIPWWYGPPDVVERLALDPHARKQARESKMLHDRKPN